MQNVGLLKSLDINLNTAGSEGELRRSEQPLLRKTLSDNFGKHLQNDEDDEELDAVAEVIQHRSVEEPPKTKTRSRFSSAFRSFRGSKSSKKKIQLPAGESILSSGGEDTETPPADTADSKKKKNKLSKKFSLTGIKRNKVNPKKIEVTTNSNLLLVETSTQTTQSLDRRSLFAADNDSKRKFTVTTSNTPPPTPPSSPHSPDSSPTKFDKVRKIQITIQGKKIEHTQNNTNTNNGQQGRKNLPVTTTEITSGGLPPPFPSATADEGDYLTAADEVRQQQKPSQTSPFKKSSKKKLKSKSKSNTSPPPATSNNSITSTISTTTTTEEKLIVTQSICDTPPRERAPAKPSRAPGAGPPPSSPPTTTGAIRKSLSHQIPKLRRQRMHVADSVDSELTFMLREGTIERGRRFPRPSSIDSATLSPLIVTQSHSLPTPPETLQPLPEPPSPPPLPPQQSSQPLPQPQESSAEAEPKSLPTFSRETTKELQDTTEREPTSLPILTTTSTIVSTIEIEKSSPTTITTTTTTAASDNTEDNQPTTSKGDRTTPQFSGNNIQNPNLSGSINNQSPEATDDNSIEEHSINFTVGTAVRPQKTSVPLAQVTFDSKDFSSLGSTKSSESEVSPPSENSIHRRKIHYVDQPSVYTDEERDILDGKREALSYLSGISEYSFDSEFSGDTPPMPAFGDLTMDQEDPPIMTSSTEKREHLYKILVIGELGTGKTSFIKRYVHQFFSQNYRATIGVDFALKVLHWDSNTIVRLQLWDIAGQERFGNMTRVYYKEAVGAFIVFDVTRSGTFDCVSKWKEDLDSKVQLPDGSPIPCILLANKCDQDKQGIVTTPEKMDEYVRENGFAGWYETSAKENINIDEAARALVNKILLNDKLISAADIADSERFNLGSSNGGQTTTQAIKSKCSC